MFRRILVPVDGSPGSERAVPYAISVAKALDARVLLCNVITSPIAPNAANLEREAAEYLDGIAERFRAEGIEASQEVRHGDPALEINKTAVKWKVQLIVMATRSRRRLEKLVLGSVADVVVRDSHLPVLLVTRGRERRARADSEAA